MLRYMPDMHLFLQLQLAPCKEPTLSQLHRLFLQPDSVPHTTQTLFSFSLTTEVWYI
jgi:hypothetical protein